MMVVELQWHVHSRLFTWALRAQPHHLRHLSQSIIRVSFLQNCQQPQVNVVLFISSFFKLLFHFKSPLGSSVVPSPLHLFAIFFTCATDKCFKSVIKNWNVCKALLGFKRPVTICRSYLSAPRLFGRPRWPLWIQKTADVKTLHTLTCVAYVSLESLRFATAQLVSKEITNK